MVKANRPDAQKTGAQNTQPEQKPASQPATSESAVQKKGKQAGKTRRPAIGGTAVQGAKSTLPKELSPNSPANQQAESYNREMRRRMQQMGTGPYAEHQPVTARDRRKKRLERLKERQAEMKRIVDAKGPSRDIKLGRRNALFLVGIIAVLIILIIVFVIVRRVSS